MVPGYCLVVHIRPGDRCAQGAVGSQRVARLCECRQPSLGGAFAHMTEVFLAPLSDAGVGQSRANRLGIMAIHGGANRQMAAYGSPPGLGRWYCWTNGRSLPFLVAIASSTAQLPPVLHR